MRKQKRWTEDDLKGIDPHHACVKAGKGRYGNVKKIEHDGIRFDSKREFLRYMDLRMLEKAGEIVGLKVHPWFPIIIGGIPVMTNSNQHMKWDKQMTYEADFSYYPALKNSPVGTIPLLVVEDVKMQSGHRTGVYKIKRALMRAMGHEIREY